MFDEFNDKQFVILAAELLRKITSGEPYDAYKSNVFHAEFERRFGMALDGQSLVKVMASQKGYNLPSLPEAN